MIPITIVDDFYNDPIAIRKFALDQKFTRPNTATENWPGKRTDYLDKISPALHTDLSEKLFHLFFDVRRDRVAFEIWSMFQLTNETYEKGWIHLDHNVDFAAVIYLTPDAPLTAGTSIYTPKDENSTGRYQKIKSDFYNGIPVDLDQYRLERDNHNNLFNKTLDVSNVFNRLVVYPKTAFHAENAFFGDNDVNSRLTQLCFVKYTPIDCYSNLERSKLLNNR